MRDEALVRSFDSENGCWPGRLSNQAINFEFCEEMAQLGVHILLSLSNETFCTAEMDQLFEKLRQRAAKVRFVWYQRSCS
jgi:hypothetical protein